VSYFICSAGRSRSCAGRASSGSGPSAGRLPTYPLPNRVAGNCAPVTLPRGLYFLPRAIVIHHWAPCFRFDRVDTEPITRRIRSNLELLDSLSPALAEALAAPATHLPNLPARAGPALHHARLSAGHRPVVGCGPPSLRLCGAQQGRFQNSPPLRLRLALRPIGQGRARLPC